MEQTKKANPIGGKILWTRMGFPIKQYLLPNVKFFMAIPLTYDKTLWEHLGIKKVSERKIISTRYDAGDYNAYLTKMYNKLERYASLRDEKKFQSLARILQMRSKALRVALLHRSYPKWYEELSVTSLVRILSDYEKLAIRDAQEFEYKRVWIPKGEGKFRPLAVPPIEWRMLDGYRNFLLQLWLWGYGVKFYNQYAGLPKGGIKKAWLKILERIDEVNDVYEFDLEKFYDTLNWRKLYEMMVKMRIPYKLGYTIVNSITFAAKSVEETRFQEKALVYEGATTLKGLSSTYNLTDRIWHYLGRKAEETLIRAVDSEMEKRISSPSITEPGHTEFQKRMYKELNESKFKRINREIDDAVRTGNTDRLVGVPQGMSTAPTVACLALYPLYERLGDNLVMFMDDGLLLGDIPPSKVDWFDRSTIALSGVRLSYNKSGYVKRDGKWIKPLKFLGLEYNPETKELKAATRKGSTMTFPSFYLKEGYLITKGNSAKAEAALMEKEFNIHEAEKMGLLNFLIAWMFNKGRMQFAGNPRRTRATCYRNIRKLEPDIGNSSRMTKELLNLVGRIKSTQGKRKRQNLSDWLKFVA